MGLYDRTLKLVSIESDNTQSDQSIRHQIAEHGAATEREEISNSRRTATGQAEEGMAELRGQAPIRGS